MRALLFTLHKYAGLFLGLLITLIALTGSIVVFDHALDEVIAPQTMAFDPSAAPVSLQTVVDRARAAVPGNPPANRIYLSRKPGSPHMVRFPGPPGAPGPLEVTVAPDGEVLAVRNWGEYAVSWIYRLHYTLLAGNTGKTIVGLCGIVLLFFCFSGIVLWWPRGRGRGRWRRALTIQSGAGAYRLNYDLHKTAGFYFLPVLLLVSFSGVALVFRGPVTNLVDLALPVQSEPSPSSQLTVTPMQPIAVDEAVRIAQPIFAGASVKRIYLPGSEQGSYHVAFNQAGESWSTHAATSVWVDQYSGKVLATWDPLAAAAGSKFMEWQFPLHNGDAFGLVGRWLVFVCGLLPALWTVTGTYLWWRKRAIQARSRRKKALCGADA